MIIDAMAGVHRVAGGENLSAVYLCCGAVLYSLLSTGDGDTGLRELGRCSHRREPCGLGA